MPPGIVDLPSERQALARALVLTHGQSFAQVELALATVIDAPFFNALSDDERHGALSTAARVAMRLHHEQLAHDYWVRLTAMPGASGGDWFERFVVECQLQEIDAAIATLVTVVQVAPERLADLEDWVPFELEKAAAKLPDPSDKKLQLLGAFYGARWTLRSGLEPSALWRDLTLLLIDKGFLDEAIDVSKHVRNPYDLIGMRADDRFAAVVSANPAHFAVDAAAEREVHVLASASEKAPRNLDLENDLADALRRRRQYKEMLRTVDAVIDRVRAAAGGPVPYDDAAKQYVWVLDYRALALIGLGRRDEALKQLQAAAALPAQADGNVSQWINLGAMNCDLGKPNQALTALSRVAVDHLNRYGRMQLEGVRLSAELQLKNAPEVARSLSYLGEHRADDMNTYESALVEAARYNEAAQLLIERLKDPKLRRQALLSIQNFAPTPVLPHEAVIKSRWRILKARSDVRAAVRKVGRIESYDIAPDLD